MRVLIIGNGIAGVTCARHLRKQDASVEITIISSETEHFFSRTALMYIYMGHMTYAHTKPYADGFWKKQRIELVHGRVVALDADQQQVSLQTGKRLSYDKLVLAMGSVPRALDCEGAGLTGVQPLYSYQNLAYMTRHTQRARQAVVVGGGLIGIEMVEMLLYRKIATTFLVREHSFWDGVLPAEESALLNEHIRAHGVDLRLSTELEAIAGTDSVTAIRTNEAEDIPAQFVGITVGVVPNTNCATTAGVEIDRGIVVNDYLETSVPGIYAIGDCAQLREPLPHRRAIEPVWYVGRMMGEAVATNILGNRHPYRPGVWFNSAKFFDIEYQTYGQVPPVLPTEQRSLYWAHPTQNKALRIVYDASQGHVIGCNAFGIRQRHAVWDAWITQKKSIDWVVEHLRLARFDESFSYAYEPAINRLLQATNAST